MNHVRLLWFAIAWGSVVFTGNPFLDNSPSEEYKAIRTEFRKMKSMIRQNNIARNVKKRHVALHGPEILRRLAHLEVCRRNMQTCDIPVAGIAYIRQFTEHQMRNFE